MGAAQNTATEEKDKKSTVLASPLSVGMVHGRLRPHLPNLPRPPPSLPDDELASGVFSYVREATLCRL